MEQIEKSAQDMEKRRRCPVCGSWLNRGDSSCVVCRHDGMEPQKYAELFWDEA
jgi:formate dehydrogenase maturation protein FdhE